MFPSSVFPCGFLSRKSSKWSYFWISDMRLQKWYFSQTTSGWAVFESKTCIFFTVFTFCTIPTWKKSHFVQRNSNFRAPCRNATLTPNTQNSAKIALVFRCRIWCRLWVCYQTYPTIMISLSCGRSNTNPTGAPSKVPLCGYGNTMTSVNIGQHVLFCNISSCIPIPNLM